MSVPVVDLRWDKKPKRFLRGDHRGGVLCKDCRWRGWRTIKIDINLGQRIDISSAIDLIKGLESDLDCPKCKQHPSTVVFTHINH